MFLDIIHRPFLFTGRWIMFRNIIFVLMYHRYKFLDLRYTLGKHLHAVTGATLAEWSVLLVAEHAILSYGEYKSDATTKLVA
jgi:hypothetical protein